jgi:hypothetical protein
MTHFSEEKERYYRKDIFKMLLALDRLSFGSGIASRHSCVLTLGLTQARVKVPEKEYK